MVGFFYSANRNRNFRFVKVSTETDRNSWKNVGFGFGWFRFLGLEFGPVGPLLGISCGPDLGILYFGNRNLWAIFSFLFWPFWPRFGSFLFWPFWAFLHIHKAFFKQKKITTCFAFYIFHNLLLHNINPEIHIIADS